MTSHTVNRPAATNHTICLWVTTDSLLCRSIKLRRRWLFTPAGVRYIHKESDKLQRSRTKHRLAVSQPKHDDTENRCLCPADRHSSTSTVFSADQKHENTILIKWFFFFFFTSYIELNFQCELSSDGRVSEKLIGFFKGRIFGWNAVYG